MAKKFGKVLMTAATLAAVAAGAYYYFKGKDTCLDDDFDEEPEKGEDASEQDRSYVDLDLEKSESEGEGETDFKEGLDAAVADATDKIVGETKEMVEKAEASVEEFFNDEQE